MVTIHNINQGTLDLIRESLRLDAETGKLYWSKISKYHIEKLGKEAGYSAVKKGEKRYFVTINKRSYARARIVYFLHYGKWPSKLVDHINRVTTDDRPINLREASSKLNNRNHSRRSIRLQPNGSYQVRLGQKCYGCYPTKEMAEYVYDEKRTMLWGT